MRRKKEYKKEYKQIRRIRLIGLFLAGLFLLSGCTKKEELLVLNGEPSAEHAEETVFMENTGETAFSDGSAGDAEGWNKEGAAGQESVSSMSGSAGDAEGWNKEGTAEPELLCVHVCGAVKEPGVYELPVGSRVYEAVQAAGGFAEDADQDYVNQAQTLPDGVKLAIPTLEETALFRASGADGSSGGGDGVLVAFGIVEEASSNDRKSGSDPSDGGSSKTASGTDSRININTATEPELCDIPGIGATRAAAIAAYRESHGGFQKPEDIMKVNGIKEGMYEKIKDSIRVN